MPYIKKRNRDAASRMPCNPGELNFTITQLCTGYMVRNGLNYANINEVMGALESAKLEFYRRVAAPYEDKKIFENGDVYPPELLS